MLFIQNLQILRSLCLNVYGLSTLVINQETLYNQSLLNQHPMNYAINGRLKSYYLNYAQENRKLIMEFLENEISLFEKTQQFNGCKKEQDKAKIQTIINDLTTKKNNCKSKLDNLQATMKFELILNSKEVDFNERQRMEYVISQYYKHFNKATTKEAKRKIKKLLEKC